MADYALAALRAGARIIGGCCGTTAEHIKAMRSALDKYTDIEPISRQEAATILGEPWANVPQAPAQGEGRKRRRKRDR